jgi:hypothetical protein
MRAGHRSSAPPSGMAAYDDTEPWERQPRETDTAWQAFVLYRDLPRRSLRALAASVAPQRSGNEVATLHSLARYSSKWNWPERCRLWDNDQARAARAAMLRRQSQTLERAQLILAHPVAVVIELLRANPLLPQQLAAALLDDLRSTRPGVALATYDRLLTLVARCALASAQLIPMERLSRGMSSTNVAVGVMAEEIFDGDSARRALDAGDPDVAALVRAVLVRAHGGGSGGTRPGQPSAPDAGADTGSHREGVAVGEASDAANDMYASPVGHV